MMRKSGVNTAELGTAIRRRREQHGLSLRDVAEETGVSASTLSRIENGTGKPDADNIARLAAWFDMPVRFGSRKRRKTIQKTLRKTKPGRLASTSRLKLWQANGKIRSLQN